MKRAPQLDTASDIIEAVAQLQTVALVVRRTPKSDLRRLAAGFSWESALELMKMLDDAVPQVARLRESLRAQAKSDATTPRRRSARRGANA